MLDPPGQNKAGFDGQEMTGRNEAKTIKDHLDILNQRSCNSSS